MKKMKKIVSLLLAMVMVLAMTSTVFAADPEISVSSDSTHTYKVFQIFTGTVSGTTLSDVKYGKNAKDKTKGTAVEESVLNALDAVKSGTEVEKLNVIKNYADINDNNAFGTVKKDQSLIVVPGYYLIKDMDDSLTNKDDAYTTYIVKVLSTNLTITPKSAKPSVDKQVQDEISDKENGADDQGWGETADHSINESFKFRLIATLTADSDYNVYETYKLVFNDVMADSVTFESMDSVTVNGQTVDSSKYSCTATEGQAGGSWTLTIEDLKTAVTGVDLGNAGATVVVTYNAHLNENAGIGNVDVNKNTVHLQYSNNPNASGSGDNHELGKTEEDTVWVFTYLMENTKVDGETNAALPGATFKLYTDEACTDANEVKLIFDTQLNAYRPIKAAETATVMTSAESTGKFDIKGLDAGTYYLKEVSAPEGYNTCANVKVEISAIHKEDDLTTTAATTISMKKDGQTADNGITVANNKGTVLPETGGMGTTIFYVVGVILVLGAVVLLITKKRMSANK